MAKPLICLDTSVLIEYFRKENKSKTFFFKLAKHYRFAISVLTKFEILVGSNEQQKEFWEQLFKQFEIIPLDQEEVEIASGIIKKIKSQNKLIELPDILIGATALTHGLKLATLNEIHFKRIESLSLIINKE